MSVIGSNIIAGASGVVVETGYQIARSLRFNSADSAYLNRTPGTAGNRKTFTWSGWVKRTKIGVAQAFISVGSASNQIFLANFGATDDKIYIHNGVQGTSTASFGVTSAVFRDPAAYYHVVVAVDTTLATATDRVKLFVNGVQQTLNNYNSNNYYPSQNYDTAVNNTVAHQLGFGYDNTSTSYFDGYVADVRLIDGQALTPSSFGETDSATGVWVPKAYTGTFGTNGFWLKFDDNSNNTATTLGKDSSGNGNNWTPNNFSVTAGRGNDSLVDSPTNYGTDTGVGGEVRGNYATLNPTNNPGGTFSNGNLDWASPSTDQRIALSSISINGSSKWYAEATAVSKSGTYYAVGVFGNPQTWNPRLLYRSDGARWIDGTAQSPNWASYTDNDVIGIAYDGTTGVATFYKNGVSQGSMTVTSTTTTQYFGCASDGTGGSTSMNYSWNFGQRPFAYTAPSGFKALNTQNLPTPAVVKGNTAMNAVTYTGNGTVTGNTQAITGLGFQPDLVWIKSRSSGVYTHLLNDALRGTNKLLYSPLTDTEATVTNVFNSFDADGFTVAYNSTYSAAVSNANGATFAGWGWNAGNNSVSNTAGTITSTVRANAAAGISVVTYTGNGVSNATVGHGLGVAPRLMITKNRGVATDWPVQFYAGSTWSVAFLNTSAAATTETVAAPTSTVFSRGTSNLVNANGNTYVAYCFAEVPGFSKIGTYTGNGSTDGVFVYLGFRPRWVMIRRSDAIDDWIVYDTARDTYNASGLRLFPRQSVAEEDGRSTNPIDFLSNGFKTRSTNPNVSTATYIYMAFAEAPFNYARAR